MVVGTSLSCWSDGIYDASPRFEAEDDALKRITMPKQLEWIFAGPDFFTQFHAEKQLGKQQLLSRERWHPGPFSVIYSML